MKRYEIVTRGQKARGSGRFKGPDHYIAVLEIPDGVEAPRVLRESVLDRLGIRKIYIGEYYDAHTGPRSRYARLMREAREFVARKEAEQ